MNNAICGLPGHGKTLLTVSRIAAQAAKEKRPVFYAGIPECKVPGWSEVPGANVMEADGVTYTPEALEAARQWAKMPAGSIVVIDEAHQVFPVRAAGIPVPLHVNATSVLRRLGLELYLITQDGNALDVFVRRRIGRYFHVWRPFGAGSAVVWEFPKWCDWEDRDARLQAQRTVFPFPREAFALYKSAQVHTVKRSIPKKLLLLPLAAVGVVVCGWLAFNTFFGADSQARKSVDSTKAALSNPLQVPALPGTGSNGAGAAKRLTTVEYLQERLPRLADLPESAPVYDGIAKPAVFPVVAGCVLSAARGCLCYSQQGTRLPDVSQRHCEAVVKHGAFDPYRRPGGMGAGAPHAEPAAPELVFVPDRGTAGRGRLVHPAKPPLAVSQ